MPADRYILGLVQRMRRKLAEVGPDVVRSAGDFDLVSLPDGDCDALRDILIAENPRVMIEIGLAYGTSALAIAEALVTHGTQGASHLIIDAFQDQFHDTGWNAIVDDCQWPSVATAVQYFERNTGWQPEPIDHDTRLRAYRLPNPRIEPGFENFEPFGIDSTHPRPAIDRRS